MLFIGIDGLKPGMRIARPIYNKMGVMLYERDSKLTKQGISSIQNFGLIGLYILEPAEPAPPFTAEEQAFEQFQTMYVFQLKDDMIMLRNRKPLRHIKNLSEAILKNYGTLTHKINFIQNVRSTGDYVYKHCLSTAMLAAMIVGSMRFSSQDKNAIICAALMHDIGKLLLPPELLEKEDKLDKEGRRQVRKCMESGYSLLLPDYNQGILPDLSLEIIGQLIRHDHTPGRPLDTTVRLHPGTQVIHVASMYDDLTAMRLGRKPDSELAAIRYLVKYPDYYPRNLVAVLTQRIHILPNACCVDLTNGEKGLILAENPQDFMKPIIIKFPDCGIYDLSDPEVRKKIQIRDIMQTMDNRIKVDENTLKQYSSDPAIRETTDRFLRKREKLIQAGRL